MELGPYLSILTGPAPLPVGALIAGMVKEILASQRYLIQAQGILLELELPMTLQLGDRVQFRVRDASPRNLVVDVSLPPSTPGRLESADARTLLQKLGLPADEDSQRLVQEFVRMNARVDRGSVTAAREAIRSVSSPSRFEAAAFLVAHGVEPDSTAVAKLARIAVPESFPHDPTPIPLLSEHARAVAPLPEEIPEAAPRLPAPGVPIRQVLESSPILRFLDRAIELVASAPPSPDSAAVVEAIVASVPLRPDLARAVEEIVRLVQEFLQHPEDEEGAVVRLRERLRLPARLLREVRAELLGLERKILASIPEFREARDSSPPVLERHDRLWAHRFASQLARIHDERIAIFEVPVLHDGRVSQVPVRVVRREGGSAKAAGHDFHATIDTDLSRLGRVRTRVDAAGQGLSVRFQARRPEIRRHLESEREDLVRALGEIGWKATVAAEVAPPPSDSPFEEFAKPRSYLDIDMRA